MPRVLLVLSLICAALTVPAVAEADVLRHDAQAQAPTPRTGEEALSAARRLQSGDGVKTGRELTPVLRTLAEKLPSLDGADRRRAERMLARPTQGEATGSDPRSYTVPEATPVCGAHFCVHYVATTDDAPPAGDDNANGVPDYVESTLAEFENVYNVENTQMGWRDAKPDGSAGGNNLIDVYLLNIGPDGLFGYAAVDPNQRGALRSAYLVMDNDYSDPPFIQRGYTNFLPPLQVTAAHEYNHVLQFNYDTNADSWQFESTATWMEDKVYDDINDYVAYLNRWADLSLTPVTQFLDGEDNSKVYGDAVLNRWVDARYGAETVRRWWEVSGDADSFAPGAYDRALRERGTTFFDAFTEFAVQTAEWRQANGFFEEGNTFPDVSRALSDQPPLKPQDTGGNDFVSGGIDHTSYALVDIDPAGRDRLVLGGSFRKGVAGAIALVGRTGSDTQGTTDVQIKRLPQGGVGKVVLENATKYSRVTAVVVNAHVTRDGFSQATNDWVWLGDDEPITLAVNDFKRPKQARYSPKRNAREVSPRSRVSMTFTEFMAGVTSRSVRIVGPGNKTVRASISLSRNGKVVKLAPASPLKPRTRYAVKLTTDVTDPGGNPLPTSRRTWRFTTAR